MTQALEETARATALEEETARAAAWAALAHDPVWARALTLRERVALGRVGAHGDRDRGASRLKRWRAQPPFSAEEVFAERLAGDGLSEETLQRLLGESDGDLHARLDGRPQHWVMDLATAFVDPPSPDGPDACLPDPPDLCWALLSPLIRRNQAHLREELVALSHAGAPAPFEAGTLVELLTAGLLHRLHELCDRTLVLELHIARFQGNLDGSTGAERYRAFARRLRDRATGLSLLRTYPVLARLVAQCLEQWVASSLEFARRLCADWPAIRPLLGAQENPGHVCRVDHAGDRHRGGRAVMIVTFSSGGRVVYKPKPLTIDRHFQKLLVWLNEHGAQPQFRPLVVLDRGSYGWVEYVAPQSCASAAAVRRFYRRYGAYVALLHVLAATDLHYENLIAAGEHPTMIDLEAFFYPALAPAEGVDPAAEALPKTVVGVGLLPQYVWSEVGAAGLDVSGLSAPSDQLSPLAAPHWADLNTDEVHLTRHRIALTPGQNRPTLRGEAVDATKYGAEIVEGFRHMYRLLKEHRYDLLAAHSPLAAFAQDTIRVLLRPTQIYAMFLHESTHPDVLRDALERDRLFDRLWVGSTYQPYLRALIPQERESLTQGDIPLFTTTPTAHVLTGGLSSDGMIVQSGLDRVHERLRGLGSDDMERQVWLLRASLATLPPHSFAPRVQVHHTTATAQLTERGRVLALARAVGDRLEALAFRRAGEASWPGLVQSPSDQWTLRPVGSELYDGLAGITLFLAYLGAVLQEERYTDLARAALRTLQRHLVQGLTQPRNIGAFEGWGGIVYVLAHLGALWRQPHLWREAAEIAGIVSGLVQDDAPLDITAGAAGAIGGLLSLHRVDPTSATYTALRRCGDHLLANQQPVGQGAAWRTPGRNTPPLTGFAHGAAGMAWALSRLAGVTKEPRFGAAAAAGIAYERGLFSPRHGNWPDLRPTGETRPAYMVAWCHGAVGIGLARLQLLHGHDDGDLHAEIETALRTTLNYGFGHNHSLCHGDLGNLELVLQCSEALPAVCRRAVLDEVAGALVGAIERHGWRCATPGGVESPGLMTGLAGIGYGLLRLAAPAHVPAVLVLAPPAEVG